MKRLFCMLLVAAMLLSFLPAVSLEASATETVQDVGPVKAQINEPYEGMDITTLTCTVEGNVTLEDIYVLDVDADKWVTEGTFAPLTNYQISYTLKANEGYAFLDHGDLEVNNGYADAEWSVEDDTMTFWYPFSTCMHIGVVEVAMNQVTAGMAYNAVTATVPEDAPYYVKNISVSDGSGYDCSDMTFQSGRSYDLNVDVCPKEDYVFDYETCGYINGEEVAFWNDRDGLFGIVYTKIDLGVSEIWIEGLPDEIQAGEAVIPEYINSGDQVTITDAKWVNADRQPVTTLEEGNIYYLAFAVTAESNRTFGEESPEILLDYSLATEFDKRTDTTGMLYIRYSLEPDAGEIYVTTAGVAEGMPVAGVTATVEGNAELVEVTVTDYRTDERPETDSFEHGQTYLVSFKLQPKAGYRVGNNTRLYVDNGNYDWASDGTYIEFSMFLNTMDKITEVAVTATEPAPGKAVADMEVTVSEDAPYSIESSAWLDGDSWHIVTGKFESGKKYTLALDLSPAEGYAFGENLTVTLNGKTAEDVDMDSAGRYLTVYSDYSFRKTITKVTLPSLPKSIKAKAKLPTFKVSSSAKYTLEANWMDLDESTAVTKSGSKGRYALVLSVRPKDGYEFAEDVPVYAGSKKVTPFATSQDYIQLIVPYSVGLSKISRVDLTVKNYIDGAPTDGVSVPENAKYQLVQFEWGVNDTGKLEDEGDTPTVFQEDRYHFLLAVLAANEDAAFAPSVDIYVNGKKYTNLMPINLGYIMQSVVCLGKLGQVKLTAPTLTLDGATLCWDASFKADGYEVYRATSKSGKYTKVASLDAQTLTWTEETTPAAKTYYYKVKAIATDSKFSSGYSNYVSYVYKCAEPVITVENGSTGKPVISWEKVSGAKKYTVYRATSETGKYTKLGTTKSLSYTDSKAKSGTEYFYKIVANASSSKYNSGYSNVCMCYVICGTPSVTLKLDAATGKPSLSWKKVDGATSYRILRQLPGEEDFTVIAEQTALTFKDETAPIDTLCVYRVQAVGAHEMLDGAYSKLAEATSGIARPSLQTGLDAQGKPQLSWEPIEGAVKYEIYRSTKSGKSYKLLTTVEVPGYTDDSVAPGKTYYYKVVAIGQVSKSAETSYVKLTGKCATPEISVENAASGKPVLSWEKVAGAKKYTVYRATSETGKYTKLGTTKSLTYTDTKATPGSVYFYKIVANASSSKYNSTYSNIVSCGVYCATPTVTVKNDATTGKPVLSWEKVTGAVRYEIYLLGAEEYVPLGTVTGTSFRDDSCAPGEGRYYGVRAIASDEAWNSQVSQPDLGRAACAMPAKPTGKNALNGKPQISWTAVESATSYKVYRATKSSGTYTLLDETDALTLTDISAIKGKTYYYKVTALCEETESAKSSYVKVTCKASSRPISYSTSKDKGSKTVWDFARFNSNRLDAYEEKDATRSFFMENLSAANGSMYYLEEEEMRMFVGKTYGMPIVTSRELAEATVWTSGDPTVATVNEVGFVTPLKEGTVTITATMPGEAPTVRTCLVHVVTYPAHTYAELEAQAKVEAKAIADYVMAYPGLTTDMDRIALAAKVINELYVANGMGASLLEIKDGDIVETMIPGYNQPYGTLVTFHSSCAGDVRALGMVLEYMGFDWYHANADKWVHQWCIVYDVDGQTAFADGSMYGIAGYGERKEDGSNWLQFNGPLTPLN